MKTAVLTESRMLFAIWCMAICLVGCPVWAADPALPASCDIQHHACSMTTASGMVVRFDIQPKPVKTLSELRFIVSLLDKEKPVTDASVKLDLTMPGMYMGKNTPDMKPGTNGRFEGKGVIPRCMSGRKTWKADVAVERGSIRDAAGFVFEVQ